MAEVAISALGLASLFNNVIEWFEYIHIAKNFGMRFQKSLLKLDNAQLRLSRWGDAVGLSGGVNDAIISDAGNFPEAEKRQAEDTLRSILQHIEKARGISDKFRKGKKDGDPSLCEFEAKDQDPVTRFLSTQMRELSIRRLNRASLFGKARFAIYDEKHLTSLIDEICKLTDDLFKLIPPEGEKETQLCKTETEALTGSLKVLKTAIQGQDELLATALGQVLNQTNDFYFDNKSSSIGQQGTVTGGKHTLNIGTNHIK